MGFKKGLYHFLGTLLKIWNAIFFAFSACTLYATIVICLYFGLKWCGVSKSAIGLTIAWFTGFVILYTTIWPKTQLSTLLSKMMIPPFPLTILPPLQRRQQTSHPKVTNSSPTLAQHSPTG